MSSSIVVVFSGRAEIKLDSRVYEAVGAAEKGVAADRVVYRMCGGYTFSISARLQEESI